MFHITLKAINYKVDALFGGILRNGVSAERKNCADSESYIRAPEKYAVLTRLQMKDYSSEHFEIEHEYEMARSCYDTAAKSARPLTFVIPSINDAQSCCVLENTTILFLISRLALVRTVGRNDLSV